MRARKRLRLRLAMSVCLAAQQQRQQPENEYLRISQRSIEASLPRLRACRQRLVVIPASLEEQPRIVELLHDKHLACLRRLHQVFGEALHQEQISREIDSLDR